MIRRFSAFLALSLFTTPLFAATDSDPPRITHVRVTKAPLGKAITIRAKIEDESQVFAPSVLVRPKGKKEFDTIDMKKTKGGYEAVIPAEQVTGDLEYVIEAFDEHGNGPAREGSPEEPLIIKAFDPGSAPLPTIEPTPPPEPEVVPKDETSAEKEKDENGGGVVTKWWFWTIIGVAAAGGATAIFFATSPGKVSEVELLVNGPDPAAGLE